MIGLGTLLGLPGAVLICWSLLLFATQHCAFLSQCLYPVWALVGKRLPLVARTEESSSGLRKTEGPGLPSES